METAGLWARNLHQVYSALVVGVLWVPYGRPLGALWAPSGRPLGALWAPALRAGARESHTFDNEYPFIYREEQVTKL